MGTLKRVAWVFFVGGCAVVAILVAKRVQPDALALFFGAAAGFLVSLPVGVLAILLLARQALPQRNEGQDEAPAPPVVVIASGSAPQVWGQPGMPSPPGMPDAPQGRRFTIGDWD